MDTQKINGDDDMKKDLLITYNDNVVYRGLKCFPMEITDNLKETWEKFTKDTIENYISPDLFFNEFSSPDSFFCSEGVDFSKVSIKTVVHDRDECQKFFERSFE